MAIKKDGQERHKITIKSYQKTCELGRIIGKKGTMEILTKIDENPCQYKELDCDGIASTTLNLRLNELLRLNIIKKIPITSNRRETHQYNLTLSGVELMKFIHKYEKIIKMPIEQQKIVEV